MERASLSFLTDDFDTLCPPPPPQSTKKNRGLDSGFDFLAIDKTEPVRAGRGRPRIPKTERRRTSKPPKPVEPSTPGPLQLRPEDALTSGATLIDFDGDRDLPDVRLPTEVAVPNHLRRCMGEAYPEGIAQPGRKVKYCLDPKRVLKMKEMGYLCSMRPFWTKDTLMLMIPIILKTMGKVTLSTIDYLCVHYSEEKSVHYDNGEPAQFFIRDSYNNCIKSYKRQHFDTCARRRRILLEFALDDEPCVDPSITWSAADIRWDKKKLVGTRFVGGRRMCYLITSNGQLKHFYWSIPNGVVKYCIDNQDEIYAAKRRSEEETRTDATGRRRSSKRRRTSSTSFFVEKVSITIRNHQGNSVVRTSDDPGAKPPLI